MSRTQTVVAVAVLFTLVTSVLAFTLPVKAQDPDFSIIGTPTGRCINIGATASYSITVSSLGGFQGTVVLDDSIDPNATNGPPLSPIPSRVNVNADQNSTFDLTISTSQFTPPQV